MHGIMNGNMAFACSRRSDSYSCMGPISKSFYKVGTYRFLDCSFVVPTLLFQTETIYIVVVILFYYCNFFYQLYLNVNNLQFIISLNNKYLMNKL